MSNKKTIDTTQLVNKNILPINPPLQFIILNVATYYKYFK